MSLIPGVAAPSLDARLTTATHRLHKGPKGGLRDGIPLDLQYLGQPGQGSRRGVVGPEPLSQNVPEMLDRVEIGRAGWPDHAVDVLLPEEVGDDLGAVSWRIIVLEDGALSKGSKRRHSNRPQNLVPVPNPVQDTVNGKERGPGTETHAAPDHHGAAAVPVVLADRGVRVPLALPPPDPDPAVVEGESEPGLVRKHDSAPLLTSPGHVLPCPGEAAGPVDGRQDGSDSRSS